MGDQEGRGRNSGDNKQKRKTLAISLIGNVLGMSQGYATKH